MTNLESLDDLARDGIEDGDGACLLRSDPDQLSVRRYLDAFRLRAHLDAT